MNFDAPDQLNDDGTVTLRIIPSNWHAYNISPDTYQTFNGDSWLESEIEWASERFGRDMTWDDFEFEYDHPKIVRDLAEVAAEWIRDTLWDIGLQSIDNVRVVDSWSPQYYNFQSDGFEMEFTCDPAELRELTPEFDVDVWAKETYSSYDGFHSFVTGRMEEADWRAQYDGEFRVESLLAGYGERGDWIMALAEAEWEIYSENVKVTIPVSDDDLEDAYAANERHDQEIVAREYLRNEIPGQQVLTN